MKHYGNKKTKLKLTEKAFTNYSNSDPLDIYEKETDNGFIYRITGIIEADGLTAAEVIETLESLE